MLIHLELNKYFAGEVIQFKRLDGTEIVEATIAPLTQITKAGKSVEWSLQLHKEPNMVFIIKDPTDRATYITTEQIIKFNNPTIEILFRK